MGDVQHGIVKVFWRRVPSSEDGTFRYPGFYEADYALLSEDERHRAVGFHFERDTIHFVAAHALVRRALSTFVPMSPDTWRFTTNAFGRPEVAGTGPEPHLRFNLTHTHGLVACVVSLGRDVGVDAEALDGRPSLDIASDVLTATELAVLEKLPASERPARFLEYWTLKEAYVKARGLGLSIPLHAFAFQRDEKGEIGLVRDSSLQDQKTWTFSSWRVDGAFQVALAIEVDADPITIVAMQGRGAISVLFDGTPA
jgi:4'-phosphopantetheinyl transferase